jgi:hypothetical protein
MKMRRLKAKGVGGVVAVALLAGTGVWWSHGGMEGTGVSLAATGGTTGGGEIQVGVNQSLQGRQLFTPDDAWNTDISKEPVDPMSDVLIASIGLNKPLHPDFGSGDGTPFGIPYVVVGGNQARVPTEFTYGDESDPGPYPIPADAPIEGAPGATTGDRHVLVIDKDNWMLYEMDESIRLEGGRRWKATSGAVFDLSHNSVQRRPGWTSADAAGLPIFVGLARYDEAVEQGRIGHALRFTVEHTRHAYVNPASHYASADWDEHVPPFGMRVRLKADVDISQYPPTARVILQCLKRYGMIMADIGSDWFVSGTPDARWNDDELNTLKRIRGSDFEVVRMGRIVTKTD